MPIIYQLSSCNTCQRIIAELGDRPNLEVVNIKDKPLTPPQLDRLAQLAGSYEALFSRRARKYRSLALADRQLTEDDYRHFLLEDYTFLKRPVTVVGERIFIGNAKQTVAATKAALNE